VIGKQKDATNNFCIDFTASAMASSQAALAGVILAPILQHSAISAAEKCVSAGCCEAGQSLVGDSVSLTRAVSIDPD